MKTICILMVLVAMMFGGVVFGEEEDFVSFKQICDMDNPGSWTEDVENFLDFSGGVVYNLIIRTDPNDATGNSDEVVPKTGIWDVAFIKYVWWEGNLFPRFGGYANNDNGNSNTHPEFFAGWIQGRYHIDTFPDGSRVDDVFIVHDLDSDGIGNNGGGYLDTPGDDGEAYSSRDILFGEGEFRGDVHQIPAITVDGYADILPKMVICLYAPYDAIYLDGIRVDYSGEPDLIELAENWLTTGNDKTNYWASGSDWNADGKVDMFDFALLAKNWNPAEAEDY